MNSRAPSFVPECVACLTLESPEAGEAVFFAAYLAGIDDAGAPSGEEHFMCATHGAMRARILDEIEEDTRR